MPVLAAKSFSIKLGVQIGDIKFRRPIVFIKGGGDLSHLWFIDSTINV